MLRQLERRSPWASSDCICRHCRHAFPALQSRQTGGREYASSDSGNQAKVEYDDFVDNFNSLSDTPPLHSGNRANVKPSNTAQNARDNKEDEDKRKGTPTRRRHRDRLRITQIRDAQGRKEGAGLDFLKDSVGRRVTEEKDISLPAGDHEATREAATPRKVESTGKMMEVVRELKPGDKTLTFAKAGASSDRYNMNASVRRLPLKIATTSNTVQAWTVNDARNLQSDPNTVGSGTRAAMLAGFEKIVQELKTSTSTDLGDRQDTLSKQASRTSDAPVRGTPKRGTPARSKEAMRGFDKLVSTLQSSISQGRNGQRAQAILVSAEDESFGQDSKSFETDEDQPSLRDEFDSEETIGHDALDRDDPMRSRPRVWEGLNDASSTTREESELPRIVRHDPSQLFDKPTPNSDESSSANVPGQTLEKLHVKAWGLDSDLDNDLYTAGKTKDKSKDKPKEKSEKKPVSSNVPDVKKKETIRERRRKVRAQSLGKAETSKPAKDPTISASKVGRRSAEKLGKAKVERKPKVVEAAQEKSNDKPLVAAPIIPPLMGTVLPGELEITPLQIPQPPVPGLEYDLDRVLFNPGVYQLQDPNSRVFNFDPYLQRIMPVVEFDYNALKEYKTSSQDVALGKLAQEHEKRYVGSTSSMTGTLGHFHYLLSAFRPVNLDMLSRGFPDKLDTFTKLNRTPNAIFLRWKNGTYAIDADKEYDGANVLMMLGKSMEKLFTLPTSDFERYRKSDPRSVTHEERTSPEAFCYTTMKDFLMRSQLDAYDPRLPGTGMFDLKTRAVVSVRMNTADFEPMTGYEIHTLHGKFESYEREYYDMIRSTMLKYMLQVRMGRMEGIFIAYHNVERIFGFQYVSLQEMDRALHGQTDPCLGDQEFKTSLEMLNKVFDMATKKFPEQSLRFHFEASKESLGSSEATLMWIFAEPMTENAIDTIQAKPKTRIEEFEKNMMGMDKSEASGVEAADGPETDALGVDSATEDKSESMSSQETKASAAMPEDTIRKAPLFAANILCSFAVNGNNVVRPEYLKPNDQLEVTYSIQEWDPDVYEKMWPLYTDMKEKRREAFAQFIEDAEEDGKQAEEKQSNESKRSRNDSYIEFLKRLSYQGRVFREGVDEAEVGQEPVIVGRKASVVPEGHNKVQDVDGYMKWLYAYGKGK